MTDSSIEGIGIQANQSIEDQIQNLISRANAAGNPSKNQMISPTKIQIDSGLIKLDQDDINFIQKNSKLNAADKFEDINLPLGPIE